MDIAPYHHHMYTSFLASFMAITETEPWRSCVFFTHALALKPLALQQDSCLVCFGDTEGPSCALGPGPDSTGKRTVDDSREHSGDVLCDQGRP